MTTTTLVRVMARGDTAANWTAANPVLLLCELGYEENTGKLKFGDGSTAWNALPYFSSAASYTDEQAQDAVGNILVDSATIDFTYDDAGNTITAILKAGSVGLANLASGIVDTDGTLAANSDSRLATQKAVKTYADALIAASDAMVFKGVIDCSTNPNYPAADRGHTYRVSVAGKIGGASGTNVEAGDLLLCLADATGAGTQASVGASWSIAQANLDGAVIGPSSATDATVAGFSGTTGKLVRALTAAEIRAAAGVTATGGDAAYLAKASNLSDVASASTARTNLGLAIGTNVQAYHANLAAIAGITTAADQIIYWTGAGTALATALTASGRSLCGLTVAQGDILYASAAGTVATLAKSTTAQRVLTNGGTSNNPSWAQVDLTAGVTGQLPVANGGTAASTASGARTNLGLGTAAVLNTGTSGGTIPRLDTANTFSQPQTIATTDVGGLVLKNTAFSGTQVRSVNLQFKNNDNYLGGYIGHGSSSNDDLYFYSANRLNFYGTTGMLFTGLTTTASAANLYQSGDGAEFQRSTSSRIYKKDITDVPVEEARRIVTALRGIMYRSKAAGDDPANWYFGLVAEEVAAICPWLVHWSHHEEDYDRRFSAFRCWKEGISRPLRKGAVKRPDGVMYDRICVLMLIAQQDDERRLAALEETVALLAGATP